MRGGEVSFDPELSRACHRARFAADPRDPGPWNTAGVPGKATRSVYLPNLLRTKVQARGDEEYCDVLIGLPILKSHLVAGLTEPSSFTKGFGHDRPMS